MAGNTLATLLGKGSLAAKLASRSFTSIDTNPVPESWTHITKIDPEDEKRLPILYPKYLQHTSAISVGGSQDVNTQNTEDTFELLDFVNSPVFHEPSAARHVTRKTRALSEFLAIPEVLNGDSSSLIGTLGEGTEYLREEMIPQLIDEKMPWLPNSIEDNVADFLTSWLLEGAVFEAYIIQNETSAAAREATVTNEDLLSDTEAAQRALAAEKHLGSPVIYVEYSGTYGGTEATDILAAIDQEVNWSRVWYGGGISSREQTTEMLSAGADTVIVGNVFHEIASDEQSIFQTADEDLSDDMSIPDIENWIVENVDLEEYHGFKFLSTIPTVTDPEGLSRQYLAQSISLKRLIEEESKRTDNSDMSPGMLRTNLQERWGLDDSVQRLPGRYIALVCQSINPGETSNEGVPVSVLSHVEGLSGE